MIAEFRPEGNSKTLITIDQSGSFIKVASTPILAANEIRSNSSDSKGIKSVIAESVSKTSNCTDVLESGAQSKIVEKFTQGVVHRKTRGGLEPVHAVLEPNAVEERVVETRLG